jgi:hypothetical protein
VVCKSVRRGRWLAGISLAAILSAVLSASDALAFDPEQAFAPWAKVISIEGTFSHFGPRLDNPDAIVQAWTLSARFSLLPFGTSRFRLLNGALDGSFEIGLEPTFERFQTVNQNFGGLGLALRYHLLGLSYGPFVPWIGASIAPGGTDLRIGHFSNETRLRGPFMNLIEGGIGVSYFLTERGAIYLGLQAQHISNAGFDGPNSNFALNTMKSMVVGFSWFVP